KISQCTYDSFNNKIDETTAEIEKQQRALLDKMNSKVGELDQHIKTLEMLLASFEIKHVIGEIDEEIYQREVDLLSIGLDVAKQELNTVKDAVNQLSSSMPVPTTDVIVTQEVELQTTEGVEAPEPEIASVEGIVSIVESEETLEENVEQNLAEPPAESVEASDEDTLQNPDETQETWQSTEETQETEQGEEETQSTETVVEGEETPD
ncbi:CdvA-like protein, partial [Candidatus Bathyarchaeota archaeon]|nr:CdvA-like protein [Candidatus Bathyarchaeota archaeon]